MGIRVHAAFSPSRGMVKSQGHNDKGFNMQIPKVTMQHTNGGWLKKTLAFDIRHDFKQKSKAF